MITHTEMTFIEAKAIYLQLSEKMTRKQNLQTSLRHITDLMFKDGYSFKQIISFFKKSNKKYSSFSLFKKDIRGVKNV